MMSRKLPVNTMSGVHFVYPKNYSGMFKYCKVNSLQSIFERVLTKKIQILPSCRMRKFYLFFWTCNGLSLFYFASGNSASRGGGCTLSPLVLPGQALVALCFQWHPSGMSPVPLSAIVTSYVGSVRGGCRGGGVVVAVYGGGARLPKQCQASPVFPLRSLHTDLVCRHPWPPDAPVCILLDKSNS